MSEPAISIDNVQYAYSKTGEIVLSITKWHLELGERVFLYGDSGSGKTTLLNLLSGILQPTTGRIVLFDEEINTLSNRKRDAFRAQNIGVVFQKFNLIPYMTVIRNIEVADFFASSSMFSSNQTELKARAESLVENLHLPKDVLHKKVMHLSTGQQQRVAIVRALINQPRLLLVDEPTSALDASARDAFMRELMDVCNVANTTLIFVSHDHKLGNYFEKRIDLSQLNMKAPASSS